MLLSSEKPPVDPQYPDVWMQLQTDMARLSSRGSQRVVSNGDMIYEAQDLILDAVRQVLGQTRRQPGR
jgi:hypothetical protein